jgi:predicted transcriptional regulator
LGRQNQVIWRRNKVQDLLIKGHNQYLIADILRISQTTVSRDIENLREQARQNMQTHLQDRLPEEYENCMAGINQVLKMSWEIANKGQSNNDSTNSNSNSDTDRTLSATVDDRTRLQALALANDCYKYKMDLVTNGVVITDAIKFVQQKKEELSKVKEQGSKEEQEPKIIGDTSKSQPINRVF